MVAYIILYLSVHQSSCLSFCLSICILSHISHSHSYFYLQVAAAPKSVIDVAKRSICPKEPFPFAQGKDSYSPNCVIDVKSCKEICGKKCSQLCKQQHQQCDRGHLATTFLFCQFSSNLDPEVNLPYVKYEIVEETNVKPGKKPYKRYVKYLTDC